MKTQNKEKKEAIEDIIHIINRRIVFFELIIKRGQPFYLEREINSSSDIIDELQELKFVIENTIK